MALARRPRAVWSSLLHAQARPRPTKFLIAWVSFRRVGRLTPRRGLRGGSPLVHTGPWDVNLVAGGLVGEGRALLKLGEVGRGRQLLNEAMTAVFHDDLEPEWAGNVYCHLMAACRQVADIGRARDWTEATATWLVGLPAAVVFTGICRVHRCQLLQVSGDWTAARKRLRGS